MAIKEKILNFIRGYRKLLAYFVTIVTAAALFTTSLVLLFKAMIDGGQFVEIIKALCLMVSSVGVGYMGANVITKFTGEKK